MLPRNKYVVLLIPCLAVLALGHSASAQSGGVVAGEPTFRAVRSASGTKGSVLSGRYIIEDPRTIFYVPEDKQIIVYFEWEGPMGSHKFEGLWKNPEGKVTVISDFSFEAKQKRFGGYWTLMTNETMPTGLWTLEARVDGESAGTYQFQIRAATRPEGAIPPPPRVPLSTAKMYQHILASTVTIHRVDATGKMLGSSLGFVINDGYVVTSFHGVDGASKLILEFADGGKSDLHEVAGFHRRQDWAVLKADTRAAPSLKRAPAGSWAVGDRCFSLDVAAEGNRTIAELDITGKNTFPGAGERINVTYFFNRHARGAAVVNEYGELVGLVSGGLIPGYSVSENMRWGSGLIESVQAVRGGLAVPVHLVSLSSPRAISLAEMLSAGHFTPPLVGYENVMNGTLAKTVSRQFGTPSAIDYTSEFSRRDKQISVVLNFMPKEKRKGVITFRVFDIDNRSLGVSAGKKVDLKPNQMSFVEFGIPPEKLTPGIYRIDAWLDESPLWRSYFRVTE